MAIKPNKMTSSYTTTSGQKVVKYSDGSKTYDGKSNVNKDYVPRTAKTQTMGSAPISPAEPTVVADPVSPLDTAKTTLDGIQKNLNDSVASGDIKSEQESIPSPADYYPRYTPSVPEETAPAQSVEEVQKEMMKGAQRQINELNDYESTLLREQNIVNQQNDRSTASVNTLTGTAGSTEANADQRKTTNEGIQANNAIRDQVSVKVQGILSDIRVAAVTEARERRNDARLDAATKEANRVTRQTEANTHIATLAQTGATIEGMRKTDPEGYAYLARQVGGEQMMQAMFTLNRPQETILDKRIEGGKYVIAYQNPLDGKTRIETLDLGIPVGYSKTIDAGDRILAVPDDWDGDPSNLITINKGLTPSQQQSGESPVAGDQYGSDLDAIIGSTLSSIPSKFGQSTFQAQIAKARNDSDKINLIATQVLRGAPAEIRSDFSNQAVGIASIDKAISKLDEGAQTGFFDSSVQYGANFFGRDYDPKLAEINSLITAAIQPYRSSVTGAAWGTQEDTEYQNLFGSTKYSPAELRARLVSVKEILKSKSATGLNTFVNPMGYYDNQFETGDYTPEGSAQSKAEAAGYDYEAMRADGLSDEEIMSAL